MKGRERERREKGEKEEREEKKERKKREIEEREERATGKFMKTDSEKTNKVENIVLQTEKRKC